VPSVKLSQFHNLQIIPIQEGQAIVLVVTDIGIILHRRINISNSMHPDELKIIGDLFNRALSGKRLHEVKRSDLMVLRDEIRSRRQVIDKALEALDNLLDHSQDDRVVITGALNIIKEPEFKDLDKLRKVLTIFEEDGQLKEILPENISEEVGIRIGKENKLDDIKEMSLVFAGYKTAGEMGKLGVIGPVRMEYWKAAGTVESVSRIIDELLNNRGLK